jgi:uncharacterized protein (UPF0335 family)
MDTGRMPACIDVPLVGGNNTSVPDMLNKADAIKAAINTQSLNAHGGNRCDHDKNQFKRPTFLRDAKRRPHCLEEAKRRIELAIGDNFRYPQFAGLFYHSDANGRRRRSERIEGVLSLALPTLLHVLNLQRMACGFYDSGNNFHYYNFLYLQDKTNQNYSRIKREMDVLQKEKIILVTTTRKPNNDGSWRTTSVQIEFTDKIFQMLELMPEFEKDRERAACKFYEKQKRLDHNREKRQMFKKPHFTTDKTDKTSSAPVNDLKSLTQKLTRPYSAPQRGRGQDIKDLYQRARSQGYTPEQAAEIVRKKYPPS